MGHFSLGQIVMSSHLRILVVEDEYMIVDDMQRELEKLGVLVIGPAPTVAMALRLLDATPVLDGAILDINLRGEKSFPVADALHERSIPFVFTTGYAASMIPEPYRSMPRFEKPVTMQDVVRAILG
jgi:response regulator RpfG family c-di-GMP phosphodiesterase